MNKTEQGTGSSALRKFPLRRLFGWLALTGIVALPASHRLNENAPDRDISYEFNLGAVTQSYKTSCEAREKMRDFRILEPANLDTPYYFQTHGSGIALLSPALDEKERAEAEELIGSIPPHIFDLIYSKGGVFVFTRDSLLEAVPQYGENTDSKDLAGNPFADRYIGLYRSSERRMFVTYYIYKEDEESGVPFLTPVVDNKKSTTHHEIGHFMDHMLGEISLSSWLDPTRRLSVYADSYNMSYPRYSDSEEFKTAYYADLDKLAARAPDLDLKRYNHYLPQSHQGVDLQGEHKTMDRARSEAFAELWSEAQGAYDSTPLRSFFPETFRLIERLDKALQSAHEYYGRQCDYRHTKPVVQDYLYPAV